MTIYVVWLEWEPDPALYASTYEVAVKWTDKLGYSEDDYWIETVAVETE